MFSSRFLTLPQKSCSEDSFTESEQCVEWFHIGGIYRVTNGCIGSERSWFPPGRPRGVHTQCRFVLNRCSLELLEPVSRRRSGAALALQKTRGEIEPTRPIRVRYGAQ